MARSRFVGGSRAPCASRRGRASSPCVARRAVCAEAPAAVEDSSSTSSSEAVSVTSMQETASTEVPDAPSPETSMQPVEDLQSSSPDAAAASAALEDHRADHSGESSQQAERSLPATSDGEVCLHRSKSRRVTCAASVELASGNDAAQIQQLMRLMDPGQPLGSMTDFAKEYGDEAFCRRLLRKYDGNVPKAAEKLKHALLWREQNKKVLTTRQCAHGSDERVVAADLDGHPILYTCLKNQMLSIGQSLDQKVVAMLQAIDNMPAGVESTIQIWDLHGLRLRMSDLNPSPLFKMLQSTEGYFAERLEALIIIDMPRIALTLKDAIWPLVPEKTRDKVKFMTADQAQAHVRAACAPRAAERLLGVMAQNRDPALSLEERRRSWMRVSEHGELVPAFAGA